MIGSLIGLFIVLCVFAVLYWGMQQLPLPPVVKTVIIVVMALVMLLFLYNMFAGGGGGMFGSWNHGPGVTGRLEMIERQEPLPKDAPPDIKIAILEERLANVRHEIQKQAVEYER